MARNIIRTLYSAKELKEFHPKSFAKAHATYLGEEPEIHGNYEIIESMKALVKTLEFEIRDFFIGLGAYPSLLIKYHDNEFLNDLTHETALAYVNSRIPVDVDCPLTGVCFDTDFLEALETNLDRGDTLKVAIENLASTAQDLLAAEYENQQDVDYFIDYCEANDVEFFVSGKTYNEMED